MNWKDDQMAEEFTLETIKGIKILKLDKQETTRIISLLTGQLADVPAEGNWGGAVPIVNITENGNIKYRLAFILDSSITTG